MTTPEPQPATPDLRQRIARAIHRYDYEQGLSGNDMPSVHHRGEADAVLAVRDAEMGRLAALVTAQRQVIERQAREALAAVVEPGTPRKRRGASEGTEPTP